MWDDLARIEANYGCVQEYYRCMEEERERYEPTENEILEREKEMYLYHRQIEILNGKPSDFAVALNAEWEAKKPEEKYDIDDYDNYIKSYHETRDWANNKTLDIIGKVCGYYGVKVDENGEWKTFYGSDNFAIQVEYNNFGRIKSKHIGNLSYEMFQNIFRDLDYCRLYPTMKYGKMIRSNMSLGNLKIADLKWYDVEMEESINSELLANGYNEEEEIKKFMEGRK